MNLNNLEYGVQEINAERVYKYSKDFSTKTKKMLKVQSIAQSKYYEQSDIIDHEEPLMEQIVKKNVLLMKKVII